MIKFEVIVSEKETVIGDFKIPPGQRALKISFEDDDVFMPEGSTWRSALSEAVIDPCGGSIYIWGTKLAAFERLLRESKRRGNDNGRTDRDEG